MKRVKTEKLMMNYLVGIIALCCMFLVSCSIKYTQQYSLSKCDVKLNEINNSDNVILYDKKYIDDDVVIYFDSELTNFEIVDTWISRTLNFSNCMDNVGIYSMPTIYYSDNLIPNYINSDNQPYVTLTTGMSEEEAFAWILQACSGSELPYGLFAGVAVYLLDKDNYSGFVVSSVENATCLTDLQYPIYEQGNLSQREQKYAWSFSLSVINELIEGGRDFTDIFKMSNSELNDFLQEKYRLELPEYKFYPYSTQYEYMINHGCLTYYINKEFNDFVLPKEVFNTSYSSITDWLKDNMNIIEVTNEIFGVNEMYDIDVIVDDGLKSTGIAGEAYADYIKIYSVGVFSHEYTHHALFSTNQDGPLSETLCDIHANTSKYSQAMWYHILTCQSQTYPYAESINEKQHYISAMRLYNEKSGQQPTVTNFNYWLFADCLSALSTEPNQPFLFRLQVNSFYYYIARVYGIDCIFQLNDYQDTVDGKSIEQLVSEWINYLKIF